MTTPRYTYYIMKYSNLKTILIHFTLSIRINAKFINGNCVSAIAVNAYRNLFIIENVCAIFAIAKKIQNTHLKLSIIQCKYGRCLGTSSTN